MSKIVIHSAVTGSFSSYFHHIMLIVSAGALVGVASWISMVGPRFVAQRMGIYQVVPVVTEEITYNNDSSDAQRLVTNVVDRVNTKISVYMENASKGALFLLFLITVFCWLLSTVAHLGFTRIILQLVDKNKSSLAALTNVRTILVSYIGASILFALYALVVMVGSAIIFVPVLVLLAKLAQLEGTAGLIFMPLVMIGVWVYLIRYVFFGYCIIDKNAGARESLRMSAKITAGHRIHLFLFLLVVVFLLGMLGALVKGVFCFRCSEMSIRGLIYVIGISTTATPLMMLMLAKVYRQLGSNK